MISYILATFIVLVGIILLVISKTKMTIVIPTVGAILLVGVVATVYQKWEKWNESSTTAVTGNKSERFTTATPNPPRWKLVEQKVVDFSRLEMVTFGQDQCVAMIPLSIKITKQGNYRIKFSGNWEMFMSNNSWTKIPWNGGNHLGGRPELRPVKGLNFGSVILLNNGEDITPVNEEGFITPLRENSTLSMRINILITQRWLSINRSVLRNSAEHPLLIIIEKEV